jgi:putative hydrolase of the HAD superfamily
MRLLEKYQVLLFDMHGVIMFGHDRFGEEQDFYRTYHALGGRGLDASEVRRCIRRCYEGMGADYEDPARFDDFPTLREGLRRYGDAPEGEIALLELVFSLHECGLVSSSSAALLGRLARTHRLGLVSDIWAPKYMWQRELERTGVVELLQHAVFSSDCRSVKPSSTLFRQALCGVRAAPDEVLFVGDSLRRDMEGAKRLGMATAWVSDSSTAHDAVDYRLTSVLELESLQA